MPLSRPCGRARPSDLTNQNVLALLQFVLIRQGVLLNLHEPR
jgi:hypothetical protein